MQTPAFMGVHYLVKQLSREFYANIYVYSTDDECKVTEYNKLRLHYVGDNKTDISVTVDDMP